MKTYARFLGPILVLALGLWACQDQVVTPDATKFDLEAAFAKPPKDPKPPPGSPVYLQFGQPDNPTSGLTYDFESEILTGQGQIQDGWVSADFPVAVLTFHFEEELNHPCWDDGEGGDRCWCESRSCLRGKCTSSAPGDDVALEALQQIGSVQGKLEVNDADVTLNSIDYDVPELGMGDFVMRAWGPGGLGTLIGPWPVGEAWYTQVEGTTLLVQFWPADKKEPFQSTHCYVRPLMGDLVDYHYRAWQ
jgi:hypothetical protein